jgi:hypothetical protein
MKYCSAWLFLGNHQIRQGIHTTQIRIGLFCLLGQFLHCPAQVDLNYWSCGLLRKPVCIWIAVTESICISWDICKVCRQLAPCSVGKVWLIEIFMILKQCSCSLSSKKKKEECNEFITTLCVTFWFHKFWLVYMYICCLMLLTSVKRKLNWYLI